MWFRSSLPFHPAAFRQPFVAHVSVLSGSLDVSIAIGLERTLWRERRGRASGAPCMQAFVAGPPGIPAAAAWSTSTRGTCNGSDGLRLEGSQNPCGCGCIHLAPVRCCRTHEDREFSHVFCLNSKIINRRVFDVSRILVC